MEQIRQYRLHIKPVSGPFSAYLNERETAILINLVRRAEPKVMLEFGTNRGITARNVLQNVSTIERYIGIDVLPDHVPRLECQRTEVPQDAGCYAADDPRFFLLMQTQPLTIDDLEPCDVAFIDGDHSEQGVTQDTVLAAALVRR